MATLDEQAWMQAQMDKAMQQNSGVPGGVSNVSTMNTSGMPAGLGGAVTLPPAGGVGGGGTAGYYGTVKQAQSDLYALQEKKRLAALDAQRRSALVRIRARGARLIPRTMQRVPTLRVNRQHRHETLRSLWRNVDSQLQVLPYRERLSIKETYRAIYQV